MFFSKIKLVLAAVLALGAFECSALSVRVSDEHRPPLPGQKRPYPEDAREAFGQEKRRCI